MHLLFLTRRIDRNDARVGFVSNWIEALGNRLAEEQGKLTVITWQEGRSDGLPENVKVYASAEGSYSNNKFIRLIRFISLIVKLVSRCDAIFVHQHPAYAIVAAPFAKILGKKIFLWYVHKQVDLKLKIATALCNGIFTASKESLRLITKNRVHIVGHGIDTEVFRPLETNQPEIGTRINATFTILSVGRISPVKGYEVLINAVQLIATRHENIIVRIVGGSGLREHESYLEQLKIRTHKKGLQNIVKFIGAKSHAETIGEYQCADVFINLSETGSLDKAVLEAMSCGVPVITSNEAFRGMLAAIDPNLYVPSEAERIADAITYVMNLTVAQRAELSSALRKVVVRDHNLTNLMQRIVTIVKQTV